MLRDVNRAETLLAWVEAPGMRNLDPRDEGEPDLRLLVVSDHDDVLLVEMADGEPCRNGTVLWIEGRGSFVVAGVLTREGPDTTRTYMRLRAWRSPAVA